MTGGRRRFITLLGGAAWAGPFAQASAAAAPRVPVLVYHRFAATVADSMTVRETTFEAHLRVLRELRCTVVPLTDVVAWRRGELAQLPPRAVALTADDAHRSQAEVMAPMLRDTGWPVTLFVYPSAVSNASYAMTWDQLAALQATGRYRIESHTYWHPHLPRERRARTAADFERFATSQLVQSRDRLRERLGARPTLLAWPFGMTDDGLMALAARLGYEASFALGNRDVSLHDELQALPRHLVTDAMGAGPLTRLLEQAFATDRDR
ncbi:polysaccharide deacetylase family protein [Ideonella sp.]|uniref:polysaccharide deacetylase family protein n=1 Tax=Ideonella sp. TaxID=1929293 RepID=UPI0035B00801